MVTHWCSAGSWAGLEHQKVYILISGGLARMNEQLVLSECIHMPSPASCSQCGSTFSTVIRTPGESVAWFRKWKLLVSMSWTQKVSLVHSLHRAFWFKKKRPNSWSEEHQAIYDNLQYTTILMRTLIVLHLNYNINYKDVVDAFIPFTISNKLLYS